ncbi:response regulator transcription factor [Mucilaginibacter litoreus]|uniref:Response regulator transcription factor n=1 Tax=Mucilaginibacter litoreus TaxID=1048221 RepID=A0ABW3ASI1_9SPHI
MLVHLVKKNQSVIVYAFLLAVLLFLMKWLEWQYIIVNHAYELYTSAIAILFLLTGVWLALRINKRRYKTVYLEKEVLINTDTFIFNEDELKRLKLSKRELEVLQLMAQGLSNQDIAEKLFVSLNTIKTHSSRLFEKLEVQRRTQAVNKAKKLSLIP